MGGKGGGQGIEEGRGAGREGGRGGGGGGDGTVCFLSEAPVDCLSVSLGSSGCTFFANISLNKLILAYS